jgi:hypothetical protein
VQSRPRGYESFPSVLPDLLSGVEKQLAVDGVRDLTLERPQGLLLRLALGNLAVEVDPSLGAGVADLSDRGHVEGVVELAVAAAREPMHDPPTRGQLDRSRAAIGGIGISVGETSNVAGVSDQRRSMDRADPIELGDRGSRGPNRCRDAAVRLLDLGIKAAHVVEEVEDEVKRIC